MDKIVKTTGIGHHVEREAREEWSRKLERKVSAIRLEDGETLVRDGLHTYMISSVVGYAIKNGDDPVAAIDRAREFGHELVFIFGLGAVISNMKTEPKPVIIIKVGDVVKFHGNFYEIASAPNNNLRLKLLEA